MRFKCHRNKNIQWKIQKSTDALFHEVFSQLGNLVIVMSIDCTGFLIKKFSVSKHDFSLMIWQFLWAIWRDWFCKEHGDTHTNPHTHRGHRKNLVWIFMV